MRSASQRQSEETVLQTFLSRCEVQRTAGAVLPAANEAQVSPHLCLSCSHSQRKSSEDGSESWPGSGHFPRLCSVLRAVCPGGSVSDLLRLFAPNSSSDEGPRLQRLRGSQPTESHHHAAEAGARAARRCGCGPPVGQLGGSPQV